MNKVLNKSINPIQMGAANIKKSLSSGNFSSTDPLGVVVTNLSVTITTTGRPVRLTLEGSSSSAGYIGGQIAGNPYQARLQFGRIETGVPGTVVLSQQIINSNNNASLTRMAVPPSSFSHTDTPPAGEYTYNVSVSVISGTTNVDVYNTILVAMEI